MSYLNRFQKIPALTPVTLSKPLWHSPHDSLSPIEWERGGGEGAQSTKERNTQNEECNENDKTLRPGRGSHFSIERLRLHQRLRPSRLRSTAGRRKNPGRRCCVPECRSKRSADHEGQSQRQKEWLRHGNGAHHRHQRCGRTDRKSTRLNSS